MKRKVIAIVALAIVLLATWFVYDSVFGLNSFTVPCTIAIAPGMRTSEIVDSLMKSGALRSRAKFFVALRLLGKESDLHPGTYEIPPHASNRDIILELSRVSAGHHTEVTFQEGITSMAIAHIAATHLACDSVKFMALIHDKKFIQSLGVSASSLEGYLFPETYTFDLPVHERDVITRMVRSMDRFLGDSLRARIASLGVSEEKALALASIVEGEAVADTERPRIAGVYWNRLHMHHRLEADPTIQYIVGGPRRLSYDDLKIESPYNTYLHEGLPPTPINNPGRRSILATLYPEQNNYLYFVARGDGSGTHRFSKTMAEHEKAVAKYRREREN